MKAKYKILVLAFILVITGYLYRLFRITQLIQAFTAIQIDNVSFTSIRFKANVTIKNPSNTVLSINQPIVSLFVPGEDTPFVSSVISDKKYLIKGDSMEVIEILIPVSTSLAGQKILKYITGSLTSIKVQVSGRAGFMNLFRYQKIEEVKLGALPGTSSTQNLN